MIGSLYLLLSSIATVGAAEPPPGIAVGWGWKDGHVLLGELNCAACHTAPADRLLVRQAPVLAEVGARVTPQYLRAFLAEPQKVKAGTPMPDLLHGLPAKERDETVDVLVHYLTSLGPPLQQRASGASLSQIERGKELYHAAGCVACHQSFAPPPRHKVDPANPFGEEDPTKPVRPQFPPVPFGDLALKTTVEALARFLDDPLHVRPSGRMPQLHLKPGEASLLAAYLLRDQYTEKEKAPGAGLDFAYFEGSWKNVPEFDKLTPKLQGDAKDFDLAAALKKGKTRNTDFAVRFQGLIDVPQDGKYRFWTKSDDGASASTRKSPTRKHSEVSSSGLEWSETFS